MNLLDRIGSFIAERMFSRYRHRREAAQAWRNWSERYALSPHPDGSPLAPRRTVSRLLRGS